MMTSKRFVLAAAALATATWVADAGAQAIAYRNLLQFDLQSYRSQATGGVFTDDVDLLSDAARLLEIDGTRIYTNFSNLSDPAALGDNLITYSLTRTSDFGTNNPRPGVPNSPSVSPDTFDSGSYLGGWVGKYDQDSQYTFHVIYQRSGHKAMFEDLDDGNLGSGFGFSTDAEFTGDILQAFDNGLFDGAGGTGDGDIDQETRLTADLQRYDDRSATRFDLGAARELDGTDWSVGGRLFWRSDHIERVAEGTSGSVFRQKVAFDSTALYETGSNMTTWSGSMEDAFKMREAGVSLNGDWHPGGWALNSRLDVFGLNVTNPSSGLSSPSRGSISDLPWRMSGETPAFFEQRFVTVVTTDSVDVDGNGTLDVPNFNPNGILGSLDQNRENASWQTGSYYLGDYIEYYRGGGLAVESVDDERTGIGFAAKVELDRARWGGDQRTWIGFNRRPMDIDATIVLAERQGSTFWWNDGTNGDQEAMATALDDNVTVSWDGDATNTVLEAGSRWTRELSSRVEMGLGVVLTRSTYDQEYTETDTRTTIINRFDDGFGTLGGNELDASQGGLGVYNEEQTLQTSTSVIDVTDETKATDIRLPVGAQFGITKKIKWQMGVMHQMTYWTRETTGTVPADQDGVTLTTFSDYNDPTNDFMVYSTGQQTSGTETITDKDEFNTTTYWYGLEWLVGDVAQFNFNGFFDTSNINNTPTSIGGSNLFDVDFFRNLAVSLTFLFD
jgi:hypothetical protein